jgi:hypothetical protein
VYALAWVFLAVAAGTLLAALSRPGLGLLYVSMVASALAVVFVVIALVRRRPPGAPTGTRTVRPAGE